jgi:hypothetical protein
MHERLMPSSAHLKLRVCGRRFNMNCCKIFCSMGSGPCVKSALSKLPSGEIACSVDASEVHVVRVCTHSIGVSNPSTFDLRFVNLQIKEYTNSDSHLSRGCLAFEGGQICPFFSACGAADMMQPVNVKERVKSGHGFMSRIIRNYLYQTNPTNMWQ